MTNSSSLKLQLLLILFPHLVAYNKCRAKRIRLSESKRAESSISFDGAKPNSSPATLDSQLLLRRLLRVHRMKLLKKRVSLYTFVGVKTGCVRRFV
jgi:hypothetical protein